MTIRQLLAAGCLLVSGFASGQARSAPSPCPAPNGAGPNSTDYYSKGNPCAFTYSVPASRQIQLLRENPQCTMFGRTMVHCSSPVTGNYGQTRIVTGAVSQPYVAPSSPPPLGVPPEQQAAADQLWQKASGLPDRNRYGDAMPLLFKGANMGDKRAQSALGTIFQNGHGVKADDRAAAYWFGAAAAQGHRDAEYALAGMYFEGEGGLPKDPAKATELLRKSAVQGFHKAQFALAIQNELGQEVARDRRKAIALLRASGNGQWVADALANPRAPAQFANERDLGNYLASLSNAEFAASWAKAQASTGSAPAGHSVLAAIFYEQWQARGGSANPR